MITACWSLKGGVGTSVVAAGLALAPTRWSSERALLVDLAGDLPFILGMVQPGGPGVAEWLRAGPSAPPDALARLETQITSGLALIHRGSGELGSAGAGLLLQVLAASGRRVVVDCGNLAAERASAVAHQVAAEATRSLLVTRPCYVAVQRSAAAAVSPSGVVVVREPGRSLTDAAIADTIQAPVVLTVALDPAVARAVDSGLLTSRLPRRFTDVMREVA